MQIVGNRVYYSKEEVTAAINRVPSILLRPPVSREALAYFVSHETYPSNRGVYVYASGTHRGPGQFKQSTWNEVRHKAEKYGVEIGLDRNNMNDAMIACAVYAHENFKAVAAKAIGLGVSNDKRLLYLMHQQGASGAMRFLKTGVLAGKQSLKSVKAFSDLRSAALKNKGDAVV